ncbi:MAG: cupin domain-containing protein [Steroidobacteraceae bacterium]
MARHSLMGSIMILGLCAAGAGMCADTPPAAATEAVKPLMQKALQGDPGKEVLMLTVEYLPGGASLSHRHDAQVFVYVLEGTLNMQVAGGPLMTLHPGETFYEDPADVHTVSANASKTKPAKIVVFMVKDKAAAPTRPAPQTIKH